MNIFFLYPSPVKAAVAQCDKHIVKMPLEAVQMLCTAIRVLLGPEIKSYLDNLGLYRSTHINHPTNVWVRSSFGNFVWTLQHAYALFAEYTRRYGKIHKTQQMLGIIEKFLPKLRFPSWHLTVPPQCVGKENVLEGNRWDCVVEAYRRYYLKEKMGFAKWNYCEKPPIFRIPAASRPEF